MTTTTTTTGIRKGRLCVVFMLILLVVVLPLVSFVSLLLLVKYYSPPSFQHLQYYFIQKPYLFKGITWHFHGADIEHLKEIVQEQAQQKEKEETEAKTKKKPKTKKKKILAVIEFFQETNSFSPVLTTIQNFEADILLKDPHVILEYCKTKEKLGHIGGFIEGVKDYSSSSNEDDNEDNDEFGEFEIVPILQARSVSGGPLENHLFLDFVQIIVDGITNLLLHTNNNDSSSSNNNNKLEGIYLSLHGAMGVEGIRDPEGYVLEQIRNVVGPNMPIGASHDLHANLTQKRMKLLTFLIGYRTNPHRDFHQTGYECAKLLVQTIQGIIQPTMSYSKLRQLGGGGSTLDFVNPMRQIFNWMYTQENLPDSKILRLSTFMVHPWLDDKELGWSTVAITNNDYELAYTKARELANMNWNVRYKERSKPKHLYYDPMEAIEVAVSMSIKRKFGCIVICDVADAVGAGAPGESTWILQALIEYDDDNDNDNSNNNNKKQKQQLTSYVTVRDVEAVNFVFDDESLFSIGDTIKLPSVGGKVDFVTNKPVMDFEGELIYKSTTTNDDEAGGGGSGTAGKIAILKRNGIHLIVQEIADPLHSPYYFTDKLGLNLWDADIVVVKNLFPFRYMYWKYNRLTLNVITPGVTNVNIHTIPYKNIPRPIYPLDDNVTSWEPRHNINVNIDGDNNNNASAVVHSTETTTTKTDEESKEGETTTTNEL